MRFNEFAISRTDENISSTQPTAATKPLTPQEAQIDVLKKRKEADTKALDAARDRQKITKAQQNLQKALLP